MTNLVKSLNYWNLAIGKGSEDLLSGLILMGCIFESEEKISFFIKDKENKELSVSSISNDNSIKRESVTSTASHEILKNELCKNFKDLFKDEKFNYDLSSQAISGKFNSLRRGRTVSTGPVKINKSANKSALEPATFLIASGSFRSRAERRSNKVSSENSNCSKMLGTKRGTVKSTLKLSAPTAAIASAANNMISASAEEDPDPINSAPT